MAFHGPLPRPGRLLQKCKHTRMPICLSRHQRSIFVAYTKRRENDLWASTFLGELCVPARPAKCRLVARLGRLLHRSNPAAFWGTPAASGTRLVHLPLDPSATFSGWLFDHLVREG